MARKIVGFYKKDGKIRPVTQPVVGEVTITIPAHEAERHEKEWETEGHWIERDGERIWIPEHEDRAHEKKYHVKRHTIHRKTIRFSGHFNDIAEKIAKEYEKKGYSKQEAEEIGRKTAADIYRAKLAKVYMGRK